MKRTLNVALATIILCAPATVFGELRSPAVEDFFVEPFAGIVFPLNDLKNDDPSGLQPDISWSSRVQIGVSGGVRLYKPLNLDVGARIGFSFQRGYEQDNISHHYDPRITMFEVGPFGRAGFHINNKWAIAVELGLGFLVSSGGGIGSWEFPEKAQLSLRSRVSVGATWRLSRTMCATFDVLSFVTDIPFTTQFQDEVGSVVSLEPRGGFQFRF